MKIEYNTTEQIVIKYCDKCIKHRFLDVKNPEFYCEKYKGGN